MGNIFYIFNSLILVILCLVPSLGKTERNSLQICQEMFKGGAKLAEPEKFKIILDAQWKAALEDSPEWATYVGVKGYNHLWTDRSPQALEMRKKLNLCQQKLLKGIAKDRLKTEDQLNLELALKKVGESIEKEKFYSDYLILDQMSGLQIDLPDLLTAAPKEKPSDYEDRIQRLRSLNSVVQQQISLLKEGVKLKVTPVKFLVEKVPEQINAITPAVIEDGPLYKVFLGMPKTWPEDVRSKILEEARRVLEKEVYPAFQSLNQFLAKEYIPKCRKDTSWSAMPRGSEWYAFLARTNTNTNMKPQEIYDLGVLEVERLKKEMEKIKDQVRFKGDTRDFHEFLRTDPQFFFEKPKDLISVYREISKKIDPELTHLFGQLPRLPYGVREMPSYKAAQAPTAYYMSGSLTAGRAGYFEVNTYQLSSRPKWEMEVLTLHETVPGRHLQVSLAQEMMDLPNFRKHEGYTAFTEGWGLYAESLGSELGLYADPYSRYGQLSYEMWRAVRLVVDTGLHMKAWSKEKALDYFMEHIPKSKLQAENEIDRYITWPGQALAYKIGQLKFLELKNKAQKSLKEDFNIRDFHDEILRHGAVPMDILEKLVDEWIVQQKKKNYSAAQF